MILILFIIIYVIKKYVVNNFQVIKPSKDIENFMTDKSHNCKYHKDNKNI